MSELLGLAAFTLAGTLTPGPNNALLWASGARFGLRRTGPHIAGSAIGMGILILCMAAGVGVAILAVPGLALALKGIGTAYLLYLAFRIATTRGSAQAATARPFGVLGATAFQFANPKAWLFALAATGAFVPRGLAPLVAALAIALTCAGVIAATAWVWAAGGAALNRVMSGGRAEAAMRLTLAVLLAASVAFIWL